MSELDKNIYYGKGYAGLYDDYMDFINYVFGFNGNSSDFKKLLPKLYRPEDDPAGNSYVAVDDGKLKAAVGAFDLDVSVAGEVLRTRGIGNVAVHPYARSHGYMRKLMNEAVDDMIRDGIDFSTLGGRRQRYNYFSYDKAGESLSLSFNSDNMRHTFGYPRTHAMAVRKISNADATALDHILTLSKTLPFYGIRKRERLYDILTSWGAAVWYGVADDVCTGYAVVNGENVSELVVADESRIAEFTVALFDAVGRGKLTVNLPPFLPGYAEKLCRICEWYSVSPEKSFSVLNYERTVGAFMRLKAVTAGAPLPDGELTLLIHGRARDENITVSVKDGETSVARTDKAPDAEYDHLTAMNVLFAPLCPERDRLPAFAHLWLPLPIYIYSADAV